MMIMKDQKLSFRLSEAQLKTINSNYEKVREKNPSLTQSEYILGKVLDDSRKYTSGKQKRKEHLANMVMLTQSVNEMKALAEKQNVSAEFMEKIKDVKQGVIKAWHV